MRHTIATAAEAGSTGSGPDGDYPPQMLVITGALAA